ncbi:MAG: hypothetical protein P8178_19335 [Candidatus Thiodiazotropha sp.]
MSRITVTTEEQIFTYRYTEDVRPAPVATFDAFGDKALSLVLRTYLGAMENRLATITGLHEAINRKFNEAGISIAFPQRDLHLDTDAPLDIRISRTPRPSGSG